MSQKRQTVFSEVGWKIDVSGVRDGDGFPHDFQQECPRSGVVADGTDGLAD